MVATTGNGTSQTGAPAGVPAPKDPRVASAEVARDLLQLRLERKQLRQSIAELDKHDPDLSLGVLPKTTVKTATVDDRGGGAAATLKAAEIVSALASSFADDVIKATRRDDVIVLVDDRSVSDPALGALDLSRRITALSAMLSSAIETDLSAVSDAQLVEPAAVPGASVAPTVEAAIAAAEARLPEETAVPAESIPSEFDAVPDLSAVADTVGMVVEDVEPDAAPAAAAPSGSTVRPESEAFGLAMSLVDAATPSVALHGRDFELPDQGLRNAVAGAVAERRSVIVPSMTSLGKSSLYRTLIRLASQSENARRLVREARQANSSDDQRTAALDGEITKAQGERVKAVAAGNEKAVAALGAFIDEQQAAREAIVDEPQYRAREALIADVGSVLDVVDEFVARVLGNGDGPSLLQRAAFAEEVLRTSREKRKFLHLDITVMGGDVLTSASFAASQIKVRGMAQATFLLTDADGRVVASGTAQRDAGDELKTSQPVFKLVVLIAAVAFALITAVWIVGFLLRQVGFVS